MSLSAAVIVSMGEGDIEKECVAGAGILLNYNFTCLTDIDAETSAQNKMSSPAIRKPSPVMKGKDECAMLSMLTIKPSQSNHLIIQGRGP